MHNVALLAEKLPPLWLPTEPESDLMNLLHFTMEKYIFLAATLTIWLIVRQNCVTPPSISLVWILFGLLYKDPSSFGSEREKVRHRGIGAESRARVLWGAVYAKLESNSEPERARVCQEVAVRAIVGVTESHREPERDRERSSKSHSHFPQTGLNLKSCVLPVSLQEPLKHL